MSIFHSRFSRLTVAATILTLGLGASIPTPVRAQTKTPVKAPEIDAAARALLTKTITLYKAAPTYSGHFSIQTSGYPDRFAVNVQLAFARPNRFRIVGEDAAGTQQVVSDGEGLIHTLSREPGAFVRVQAPRGKGALQDVLAPFGADGTALATLLTGADPLAGFGKSLRKVSLGAPAEGVDVVSVEFVDRAASGTVVYVVGKDDGLLKSATLSQTANGKTMTSVETHSEAKLGAELPDSTFLTGTPQGLEQVEKFAKPPYDPRLFVGGAPFDFPVNDIKGQPVSWDQYKGKVVLVDFWATWCPPCVEEAPAVVNTYHSYKDEGLEIIGVSLDAEREALDGFTAQNGMTWRQIFDGGVWDSETPRLFGIASVPMTIVVGRDGKIAALGARGQQLNRVIERALRAPTPDPNVPLAEAEVR